MERGYPKTIVLFFHEFVLFLGLGTLPGKIVSDGEVVHVQEQVLLPVLWGIFDPLNSAFPVFPPASAYH